MFQRMVPPKFSTHEDCREAVCCCCGVKTDKKRISVREEALVVEFAKKEYDSKVQSYPAGLCLNCRRGKILVGSVSSHGSLRSHRSHGSIYLGFLVTGSVYNDKSYRTQSTETRQI